MPQFPSVDWFDAVRDVFNNDEAYHGAGGGACDTRFGIVVGKQYFRIVMEGLECTSATSIRKKDLAELDFYLEMEPALWRGMIENIAENGSANLDYTLNTLDHVVMMASRITVMHIVELLGMPLGPRLGSTAAT